ncbi:MAG: SDR family oxidoreductase [Anaerolineales bacterium]|nr:SDR family oxidoreductase [Anaerolineales bacterium]
MFPKTSRVLKFEEIQVGDEAAFSRLITQEDVQAFAQLTGDLNPLHLDEGFARRVSYGKPVVYGMLSASFISTMIGMLMPGQGALWTSQTLEFIHPAYVGDTLQVKSSVKQKSPSTRTLVLDVEITNQMGQKLVTGEAKVKMLVLEEDESMSQNSPKVVLVIGGSRGIGAASARRLAQDGYTVIVNYHRSDIEAKRLVAEIEEAGGKALAFQADVSCREDVENLLSRTQAAAGRVDMLVFCAAPESALKPFEDLPWEAIQHQLDVQIKGAYHCASVFLPGMLEQKSGAIVFIGSIAADGVPPLHQLDYVVAKSALSALARSLAVEYGPKGIRVNVVSPGMTLTERTSHLPEKARLLSKANAPLRRLAEAKDVANTVSFLLSPAAEYITGETIRVAGGIVMQ